jgi:membrane-bound ClpP family serine protease
LAPPVEGPPHQPGPYGQGPGGYGEALSHDGGGWRRSPRNGYGLAALVLGIVSILLFPGPGIILGLLGIIFGILGLRLISKGEATNTGMAIAGIVLSAIGLTLGALVVGFAVKYWPKIDDCLDEDKFPTSQQREDCVKDKLPDWATANNDS